MNYKDLFKKYWFVGLIGIVLIVFIGIYAVDAYNNRELTVSSKQVDGKYVVYSVDGDNVYADDFYNSLFTSNGLNCEFIQFEREIFNKAYETTEEMSTLASNYASYMFQQYGEEYISDQLKQMGYIDGTSDLIQYYIDSQKSELLVADYIKANKDDVFTSYAQDNSPRMIYHILVKVADISSETAEDGSTVYTANPTAEEQEKLNKILEALKTKAFEEVAKEYSDDTSGQQGGMIGVISNANASNYYPIFSETSLTLSDDEVSEVITSQAGYHIIWNAGSSLDILLLDSNFIYDLQDSMPALNIKAIMAKANELGYEIVDKDLLAMVNAQLESEVNE